MKTPIRFMVQWAAILFTFGLVCSCGTAQSAPDGTGAASATAKCPDLAKPAVDQALAEVAKHTSCTVDADCVSIGIGSACFDLCSRAVNKNEVDAVNAALASADCTQFKAAGCTVEPPPCVPPTTPVCKSGQCE